MNYESMALWQLFHYLDEDNGASVDPYLAQKITDERELFANYHLFAYARAASVPLTFKKINKILSIVIDANLIDTEWRKVATFARYNWLSCELRDKMLKLWINNNDIKFSAEWVYLGVDKDSEYYLPVLEKLISIYKSKKTKHRIKHINKIFINTDKKWLHQACEILSNASGAITVCLLNRDDIADKFIIKGLRALSKLSKQRDINIKINFQNLEQLSPKMRMDAMTQLMGVISNWNRSARTELPFKIVPTRDDLEQFLFPCSLKYNDKVSILLKRYDEIINPKPKIPQEWEFGNNIKY